MAFSANTVTVNSGIYFTETQSLTRAAPTTDATEGVGLYGVKGFTVVVTANSGQTITNLVLDFYGYDAAIARWCKITSATESHTAVGNRCWMSLTYDATLTRNFSRVLPALNGTTVSGGTDAVVTVLPFHGLGK